MTAAVVYITSLESASGKSLVSFGTMEAAAARSDRIGYFRPVIAAGASRDPVIEMMRRRFRLEQSYEDSYGVTTDDTRGLGETVDPVLVHRILAKFERLAEQCDVITVEGTDYTGASAAFEFALNADVATHLGAQCVLVVRAHAHRLDQLAGVLSAARVSLAERHLPLLACVVNRVPADELERFRASVHPTELPVWFIPEEPALSAATLTDIARELDAEVLVGGGSNLGRPIGEVLVAAMTLPNVLESLRPDCLLVVPGDRSDVILAALTARYSSTVPSIAGVLLTGGLRPHDAIMKYSAGLTGRGPSMLLTGLDTYRTVAAVERASGSLESGDERRLQLALRLFEDNVDVSAMAGRLTESPSATVTPVMFERRLLARARADKRHIVLPEGSDDRILTAADRLLRRDVVRLTLLGDPGDITARARELGLDLGAAQLIDPHTDGNRARFADVLLSARARQGMTATTAHDLAADPSWFGTLMVQTGLADGMVSGAMHTTADTVRPALKLIRTAPGTGIVSSVFLMAMPDRVLVYGDCAVVPDPTAEQLADIAISSAGTARAFGIEPYVAMLSYSTGTSGAGADVVKVEAATELVRRRAPGLLVEGPIQFDAAVDPVVAAAKLPGSPVAGHATVLVFPDLNTGNNTYKAVQRSSGAVAIGPVLQGLRLPVNDLSRGATVADIVNTVAITAIQAQSSGERQV